MRICIWVIFALAIASNLLRKFSQWQIKQISYLSQWQIKQILYPLSLREFAKFVFFVIARIFAKAKIRVNHLSIVIARPRSGRSNRQILNDKFVFLQICIMVIFALAIASNLLRKFSQRQKCKFINSKISIKFKKF